MVNKIIQFLQLLLLAALGVLVFIGFRKANDYAQEIEKQRQDLKDRMAALEVEKQKLANVKQAIKQTETTADSEIFERRSN